MSLKPVWLCALLLSLITFSVPAAGLERAEEVRNEMWGNPDKNFKVTEIPKKWIDKSAVIIAQMNRFEYRKAVMLNQLRFNEYNHFRIKLIDKNAVNKYAEITYSADYVDATGENKKIYVGFKIIKPGGKEIIIDNASAVKMEKKLNNRTRNYYKLAMAGLEPGDILDYYICEESTLMVASLIHFFDPVIHPLPQEYPLMNHKLQFRAERRCYINLKSLNGAPELKLDTDDSNDEQYYTLEVSDLDGVEGQRWLFPYRELPTIKFRAAYASGKGMRSFDVLLGEQGEVKSSVSRKEVEEMAASMLSVDYDVKFLTRYAKKNLKEEKDPFELASDLYYYYRNNYLFNTSEAAMVEGKSPWDKISQIKFVDVFSTLLKNLEIPHDIVLTIPRNISSINDLLMEHEIQWLIRVKKGSEELYLLPFDLNTVPGDLSGILEETDAYAIDGMLNSNKWQAKIIKLPSTPSSMNQSETEVKVDLTDLNLAKLTVDKSATGYNKAGEQYSLMDVYDLEKEELAKFEMEESFTGYSIYKKKYVAMKDAYLSKRSDFKQEILKDMLSSSYDLKVKDAGQLVIDQTGRYGTSQPFKYNFTFTTEDLIKKSGPNYLVDIGKLIEKQVEITEDELARKFNVYFENRRAFIYKITLDIPKGYKVQGLEKLNQRVENKFGRFVVTAKAENGKVTIETQKQYDVNYATAKDWPSIIAFLNAANSFSSQKLLLKKS